MDEALEQELEKLLEELQSGHPGASAEIWQAIYQSLRNIAQDLMRGERKGHTLDATALVHEAYIRWFQKENALQQISSPRALFYAAREFMRFILTSHARRKKAAKREGALQQTSLDETLHAIQTEQLDVEELHEALQQLEEEHERASQVLTLRFYFNCTVEETAKSLGISKSSAEGDFRLARAWLRRRLKGDQ